MNPFCEVRDRKDEWPYISKCRTLAVYEIVNPFIVMELDNVRLLCEFHSKQLLEGYPDTELRRIKS